MTARPCLLAGSLFTGIAGMDLAAQWAGFEIEWQVENDPFCIAVLEYHYPDVYRVRDVRDAGKHNLTPVPFIFGGFPCQDISTAGRGAGILAGAQSGLWREFARIIGEIRPRLVLIENVPAITTRDGVVVLSDLAQMGYDARWGCLRASDAGASHQRERWFCVAYPHDRWELQPQGSIQNKRGWDRDGGQEVAYPASKRNCQDMALTPSQSRCDQWWGQRAKETQRDGVGEQQGSLAIESRLVRDVTRVPSRLDQHRRIEHASPQGNRTSQILRPLRTKVRTKNDQWSHRGFRRLQTPKILQSRMLRGKSPEGGPNSIGTFEKSLSLSPVILRKVWNNREIADSSYQWESSRQCPFEPNDIMRLLSRQMALGERQNKTQKFRLLQNMRDAFGEVMDGDVPQTLSTLQEIWRSLPDQAKAWIAVRTCQNRLAEYPFPAPPGQNQYDWEAPRVASGVRNRRNRLHALGNAVVPQVVYPLMVMVREMLGGEA